MDVSGVVKIIVDVGEVCLRGPAVKDFNYMVQDSLPGSGGDSPMWKTCPEYSLGDIPDLVRIWRKWWWNQKRVATWSVSETNRGS